jgi:cytochrome c biogenesis protein CcdA
MADTELTGDAAAQAAAADKAATRKKMIKAGIYFALGLLVVYVVYKFVLKK